MYLWVFIKKPHHLICFFPFNLMYHYLSLEKRREKEREQHIWVLYYYLDIRFDFSCGDEDILQK